MARKGQNSYFTKSPKAEELMACIDRHLGQISNYKLYRKLKEIDPDIPTEKTFYKFIKGLETRRQSKALVLLNQLRDLETKEDEEGDRLLSTLLKGIHSKLLGLGDAVLEQEVNEVVALVQEGKRIPVAQRERVMGWLFKGLKQQAENKLVELKINADVRAETIFDNLFKAAQYGKVNKAEVIEVQPKEVKAQLNA